MLIESAGFMLDWLERAEHRVQERNKGRGHTFCVVWHWPPAGQTDRHQQGRQWPGNTKSNPMWLECGEDLPGETNTKQIAHTPWAMIICASALFEVRL